MTITYPNGAVFETVVLSHENDEVRAIAAGCDEVMVFTRIHGTWISEELEPVEIQFAWECRPASRPVAESDCICSKDLAAHLIQKLFSGCEPSHSPFVGPKTLFSGTQCELRAS